MNYSNVTAFGCTWKLLQVLQKIPTTPSVLEQFSQSHRLIAAFQETGFCGGCVLEQSPSRPHAPGTSGIYIVNKAITHEDFRLTYASNYLVMNMPTPLQALVN
jgi:hypothetical protein